jgi:Cu(I)/Ag(I) efflux system protein CusF
MKETAMKFSATVSLILALSVSSFATAQPSGTAMPMDKASTDAAAKAPTHQATGIVKAVNPAKGTVTLAHGPVKSLKWSAMTMPFAVKDKTLFDKLVVNKEVTIDFSKQDSKYVVTAVK